jgi:cephalosporin hydroxylase
VYYLAMDDKCPPSRLLAGFYEPQGVWRWTGRTFAVALDPPRNPGATYLELDCTVPEEVMEQGRTPTLIASVNGIEVGRQTFFRDGRYSFVRYVPARALRRTPAEVQFEMDGSVKDHGNGRSLGLIAVSIGFKDYEQTAEFRELRTSMIREGLGKATIERDIQVPPAMQLELRKLFEGLPVWSGLKFQNVPLTKNPLDLWMAQQILYEVRPEFVIETGTGQGGSALYWANALHGMGLDRARVLTVDAADRTQEAAKNFLWKKYVEFIRGGSTEPAVVARIAARVRGSRTVVILDSDLASDIVLAELRAYAPLVSRGGYLIVQNTSLDRMPSHSNSGPGPYHAVSRFLAGTAGADFETDTGREMMLLTRNPGGWLRRK